MERPSLEHIPLRPLRETRCEALQYRFGDAPGPSLRDAAMRKFRTRGRPLTGDYQHPPMLSNRLLPRVHLGRQFRITETQDTHRPRQAVPRAKDADQAPLVDPAAEVQHGVA